MRARLYVVALAGLCLVALLSGACGNDTAADATQTPNVPPVVSMPSQLLGLKVTQEDISSRLDQNDQPYIDSVGLFAFRRGQDVLEATLQVSRFTSDARPEESNFRGSIISRIGGVSPRLVRVEMQDLYLTSGSNQVLFIWFKERGFFVLTVRRDYPFPRTLVRRLIESDLEL